MPIKNERGIPNYIRGSEEQLVKLFQAPRDETLERYLAAGGYQVAPSRSLPDNMIVYDVRDVPLPSLQVDPKIREQLLRRGFTLTGFCPKPVLDFPGGGQFAGSADYFFPDWHINDPLIISRRGRAGIQNFLRWYNNLDGPLAWYTDTDIVSPALMGRHVETVARAITLLDAPQTVQNTVRAMMKDRAPDEDIKSVIADLMRRNRPRYRVIPIGIFQRAGSPQAQSIFYYPDSHVVMDSAEKPHNEYIPGNGRRLFGGRWQSLARLLTSDTPT